MAVLLNGQSLPGLDHRVTVTEQIERKDLSGETSVSAGSHGGWKPALVSVRLLIDMETPAELAALRALYHQADEATGVPALLSITEPACGALGIHRVRFTDFLRVTPSERQQAWEVTVTLIEEKSVPERAETRRPAPAAAQGAAPSGLQTTEGKAAPAAEEGFIERVLSVLNEQAGKLFFDEDGAQ
jgi:hypothetical protein